MIFVNFVAKMKDHFEDPRSDFRNARITVCPSPNFRDSARKG
jgi:hypothetical protein